MGSTSSVQALSLPAVREPTCEDSPQETAIPRTALANEPASLLNVLFHRYSRLVLTVAQRILGDKSEAEEVVQEVFLYVYLKENLFNPARGSEKTWIMQIALSRALDRKLYLARRGFYGSADNRLLSGLLGKTDLERETAAKLNRRLLERAVADLTPVQRRTIRCFYFEGLELREISEQFSEPLENVRHHLYRGLKRLRASARLRALR
jgi:RNA polymerase sigma-70 factor (ECF subfamily)